MGIVATNKSNFTPHPEGQYAAVCCDIVDLGLRKSEWQGKVTMKHKVRIVFMSNEKMKLDDGRVFPATVSQLFTLSLSDKGNLRKFIEQWLGRKLSKNAINNGIDLEELIGHKALITVEHSDNGEYANVLSISPLPAAMTTMAPAISPDYVRIKDRPPRDQQDAQHRDNERASQRPAPQPMKVAESPRISEALRESNIPTKRFTDEWPEGSKTPDEFFGPEGPSTTHPDDEDAFPSALEDQDDDLPF